MSLDIQRIKVKTREKMNGYCWSCDVCSGEKCASGVPGMGGAGTGASFVANYEALRGYRLNMRTLHNVYEPDLNTELFGVTLSSPILAAPITGVHYNMGGALTEEEYVQAVINGCKAVGTIGMTGDGADPDMYDSGLGAIADVGGWGIPIIKPRSQEEIINRIRKAEACGAVAVGVDVDGAGLITMALKGQPVGPKTPQEMRELIESTKLPFIVKGIMTVDEALLAVELGAAAIVVSNHGGRVLDHCPGAAEVLPEIAEAVKGKITILADGGIRTGVDVLKLLALGADGVLVGRPMTSGAFAERSKGVAFILEKMAKELKQAMILTGVPTVKNVRREVVR